MIRRTIFTSELLYWFCKLELSQNTCLSIVSKLFGEVWDKERTQYVLDTEHRSSSDIAKVLEDAGLDGDYISPLVAVFQCSQDDLEVPAELMKLFKSGERVAVFTGAGASAMIGVPGWGELAARAVSFLYEKKGFSHLECEYLRKEFSDPKQLLTVFHDFVPLDSPAAMTFYCEHLKAKEDRKRYNIYSALARLNCVKVTTNLEDEFGLGVDRFNSETRTSRSEEADSSKAIAKAVPRFCVPSGKVKSLTSLSVDAVYHLHGTLNTLPTAVMTTRRYVECYYNASGSSKEGSTVFEFLKVLFRDYTVVFVGSSLSEFVMLERLLGQKADRNGRQHFALLPGFSGEMAEFGLRRKYLSEFGITPVPYFLDMRNHERLHTVLESWANRIEAERKIHSYKNLDFIREVISNG